MSVWKPAGQVRGLLDGQSSAPPSPPLMPPAPPEVDPFTDLGAPAAEADDRHQGPKRSARRKPIANGGPLGPVGGPKVLIGLAVVGCLLLFCVVFGLMHNDDYS